MTTIIGEKLAASYKAKNNDVNNFIWKGPSYINENGVRVQKEFKLMESTAEELQSFYDHCNSMLRNTTNKNHPGRYVLLNMIQNQHDKCNTELYLRFLEQDKDSPRYPRITYLKDLKSSLNNEENRKTCPKNMWKEIPIKLITQNIPEEFQDLKLSMVMDGCSDKLGKFDNSHITINFLTSLGIWFTSKEMKKFTQKDENGKIIKRLQTYAEYINFPKVKLYVNPSGLNAAEFKAMLSLHNQKYTELTDLQLKTLVNKVLFRLEDTVENHIMQWKERIKQIQKVAKIKNIELKYHPDDID